MCTPSRCNKMNKYTVGQILRWQFLIANCLALMILDIRWFPSFFWWIIFSIYFLCLMKNWKSKLSFFAKWTIKLCSFTCSSLFISVAFSNASWKVKFWPHFDLASIFLTIKPCRPCWMACANFSKSGFVVFSHVLWLWNNVSDLLCFVVHK